MSPEAKQVLANQAYEKAAKYELDYGCCPRCAPAAGTATRWVIDMTI